MDRFIGNSSTVNNWLPQSLKSNMDRFIVSSNISADYGKNV